jgi:hypothetical protein
MSEVLDRADIEAIDPRLLEEALRRGCAAPENLGIDVKTIWQRILAAARRGTRDMYGLVAAAKNPSQAA